MDCLTLLTQAHAAGLEMRADGDRLVVRGPRSAELLAQMLLAHKPTLLKLLTAPPADCLSETPCPICGSRERWTWLDGRALCRVCLILDLAPLTLVRQGWPEGRTNASARKPLPATADSEMRMDEGTEDADHD